MRLKLTYEDYKRLPNDGKRHEIIDGVHYNHAAPRTKHQIISRNLEHIFEPYIRRKKMGQWFSAPYDVVLSSYDTVQPDKIFVSKDKESIITELNIQGVPDLIIEITSPENPGFDKETKMSLYARHKLKHYWIVDAQIDALEIYEWTKKGYKRIANYRKGDIFKPAAFRGPKVKVSQIFQS